MRRYILLFILLGLFSCSNDKSGKERGSQRNIDEQERPQDWSATWELGLRVTEVEGERDVAEVTSFQSSKPIQGLVDQLYQFAFSGDANVHAPNLFGEMDESRALSPEDLLNEFESYDTVTVEDLMTGALKDTVIDNSFSLQKITSFHLGFGLKNQKEVEIDPVYAAFGLQVFDEETGRRRGDNPKMYLKFEGAEAKDGMDILRIYTDSLAVFKPNAFMVYSDQSNYSISDYLAENYGQEEEVLLKMKLSFSFREARLVITDVKVVPSETPKSGLAPSQFNKQL